MVTTVNEQGEILSEIASSSSTQVAEFDPIEAGLLALRTQIAETVYDITTTAGDRTARELRRQCITLRTTADDVYEKLNRPMLEKQALIRGLKKRFQDGILLLEKPIDLAIKAQEAAKEIERLRKAALEEARIKALREKIQAIAALPASAVRLDAAGIAALDHTLSELVVDEASFEEFAEEVADLKAYIRSQLGELFTLALGREAETERVRVETLRLAEERRQQAQVAILQGKIAAIKAHPLQAFNQSEAAIVALTQSLPVPAPGEFGELYTEALAAFNAATQQLGVILEARVLADQLAAAAVRKEQEIEDQRRRDAEAAIERQRIADEQHAAAGRELRRQQEIFEAERLEARRVQAEKDAALAVERQALQAQLKALQPKPVPVVVEALPVTPAPAPVKVAAPVARASRPSDAAIVTVLAETFDVHNETVIDWLRGFDADAVQQALNYEEIPA
jgi:hypothetical protein